MKIAVVGLWHLGCVTAACLANAGYQVIAYDANFELIQGLRQGKSPIFEPGLDELLIQTKAAGTLYFSLDAKDIEQADIVWVAYDTPVDDHDLADLAFVMTSIENLFPYFQDQALVLISSQISVGSTRQLVKRCQEIHGPAKNISFAYSPENLRLGKAVEVFTQPDRVVVGLQTETDKDRIQELFRPFTQNIIWMSLESAEMTKHAINAFLATSVVFINELSNLCERTGADAREVEQGLKTEERIGPQAYLRPGGAIGGGTLLRDIHFLIDLGQQQQLAMPFFSALLKSNQAHKQWSCQRILHVMKSLKNKTIATLGLTYKAGTNTLRRSTAIETGVWLSQQGAKVVAYDPVVNQLPQPFSQYITLQTTLEKALHQADAVVITTEWPEFFSLTADELLGMMKQPLVFDASGFLMSKLSGDARIRYYSVGRQA